LRHENRINSINNENYLQQVARAGMILYFPREVELMEIKEKNMNKRAAGE